MRTLITVSALAIGCLAGAAVAAVGEPADARPAVPAAPGAPPVAPAAPGAPPVAPAVTLRSVDEADASQPPRCRAILDAETALLEANRSCRWSAECKLVSPLGLAHGPRAPTNTRGVRRLKTLVREWRKAGCVKTKSLMAIGGGRPQVECRARRCVVPGRLGLGGAVDAPGGRARSPR